MASTRAYLFSSNHPFLSLSFMANILSKKASTCSSFFKPWATISVYSCGKALAFPINPLDKNVVKSSLFFSELMNLFQEAGSYILHLSGMWQWTLRLCIFLDFPQAFAEIRWGSLTSTGTEYPCSKWHTKNSGEHEGSLSMHNKFFLLCPLLFRQQLMEAWLLLHSYLTGKRRPHHMLSILLWSKTVKNSYKTEKAVSQKVIIQSFEYKSRYAVTPGHFPMNSKQHLLSFSLHKMGKVKCHTGSG